MLYSLLQNQTPSLPQSLPARWRAPDGYTVTNLAERSAEQLQAWGWYPVTEVKPELPAYASYGTPEMALDGDTVTATYPVILPDLAQHQTQRLNELAAIRYQHETAGITLSGMSIETDRESQALITGAWSFSQLNPAVLIDWKATTGWIQIDAATIAGIAGAVAAHVQACFSAERAHAEAIAALETVDAVAGYDLTTGWPA